VARSVVMNAGFFWDIKNISLALFIFKKRVEGRLSFFEPPALSLLRSRPGVQPLATSVFDA